MPGPFEPVMEIRVHERDDPRIGRILDLIDEASRPRPLPEVLGVLCGQVAAIVEAQVASIYVRDEAQDDVLVMRANVGFPGGAIGQVRLRVGEGLTGFAAECMRPVTVTAAAEDTHFKPVPGLGEEEFPVFLAVPILVGRRAEAVLVLQRRFGQPFADHEVVLSAALATSFAYALERAREREDDGEGADGGPEPTAPRKAHLTGEAMAPGVALGRVETAPTFEGLAALARARGLAEPLEPEVARVRLTSAVAQVAKYLSRGLAQLEPGLPEEVRHRLGSLFVLWDDQRFLRLLDERALEEPNPALALGEVAKVYARAPYSVGGAEVDRSSQERSVEAEALCLTIAARVVDERSPTQGSVLLSTDRLPAITALVCALHRASAIAVGGPLREGDLGVEVARAAGLPVVGAVGGLFAWTRVGDRVLVDGDDGVVRVNPSAATIARFRRIG